MSTIYGFVVLPMSAGGGGGRGRVSFYRCPVSSAHPVSVQITLSDVGYVNVQ